MSHQIHSGNSHSKIICLYFNM